MLFLTMASELLHQIALTLISGVGDVNGKKLVAYCGSVEAVFKEKRAALLKIPGIGTVTVNSIHRQKVLKRAEEEIRFIEKYGVRPLFFTQAGYPQRLLNCEDGPLLLYFKGTADLNAQRVISIVGTRRATNYGRRICEQIIADLKPKNILVVSGLAYGIDSCAHRKSLECEMETVGVLAHGLDRIYPAQNRKLAEKMLEQGGLLTEFPSGSNPDRENFPKRNRIVAGMSDAVVVVESGKKGGATITAGLGNSYNRDVFAIPGRVGDDSSRGCNFLIRTNRAALAENGDDIAYLMGWDDKQSLRRKQTRMFVGFSEEENRVLNSIRESGEISIDRLVIRTGMATSKVAAALLNLEFEGVVQSLPGKLYKV
ncbi:MAG: DNA-processing protein DprA [Bacteroidales bacterium]|nr:DNA-processing protein DprA [Bacteroidales bacterium]